MDTNNGGAKVQNRAVESLLTGGRRFAAHFDERQDPDPDSRIRINVMRTRNPGSDRVPTMLSVLILKSGSEKNALSWRRGSESIRTVP